MLVLITYDVSTLDADGRKRLRKVAKKCEEYGVRVQNSVFECILDSSKLRQMEIDLQKIIDPKEDSLRIYKLGNNYRNKVKHFGNKNFIDVDKPLIF